MGTKLQIKGSKDPIDLPRGASIPSGGDVVFLTLKGEKKQKVYTIYLIEHTYDLNTALPIGNCTITLEEVKAEKSKKKTAVEPEE